MNRCVVVAGMILIIAGGALYAFSNKFGCDEILKSEGDVKVAWHEIAMAYDEKMNLVSDFVATLKKYPQSSKKTDLSHIIEVRAKLGQVKADFNDLNDVRAIEKYQSYHKELSTALANLITEAEKNGYLVDNQESQNLYHQLMRVEDHIMSASVRYNQAVDIYNAALRNFPDSLANTLMLHLKPVAHLNMCKNALCT